MIWQSQNFQYHNKLKWMKVSEQLSFEESRKWINNIHNTNIGNIDASNYIQKNYKKKSRMMWPVKSNYMLRTGDWIFLSSSVLQLFPISCEPTYTPSEPGAGWRNREPSWWIWSQGSRSVVLDVQYILSFYTVLRN